MRKIATGRHAPIALLLTFAAGHAAAIDPTEIILRFPLLTLSTVNLALVVVLLLLAAWLVVRRGRR